MTGLRALFQCDTTQRCKSCGMMNKRRRSHPRSKLKWTVLEKRILALLYPHLETAELAAVLGRSVGSLEMKTARAGFSPRLVAKRAAQEGG